MDAMNSITGGCEVHERSSHIGVAVGVKENRMEEEGNNEIIIKEGRNLKKKKSSFGAPPRQHVGRFIQCTEQRAVNRVFSSNVHRHEWRAILEEKGI